ncbi:hypothetical protein FRX31_006606, partial [Thalictrum thalictroides]
IPLEELNVLPPIRKRQPGRTRKQRRIDAFEAEVTGKRRNEKRCRRCGEFGHNSTGCQNEPEQDKDQTMPVVPNKGGRPKLRPERVVWDPETGTTKQNRLLQVKNSGNEGGGRGRGRAAGNGNGGNDGGNGNDGRGRGRGNGGRGRGRGNGNGGRGGDLVASQPTQPSTPPPMEDVTPQSQPTQPTQTEFYCRAPTHNPSRYFRVPDQRNPPQRSSTRLASMFADLEKKVYQGDKASGSKN